LTKRVVPHPDNFVAIPATPAPYGIITMLALHRSPFDLFDRLEQQLQTAERVPPAEVHETEGAYTITLELPGVDRSSIDVKATDRSLIITAERRALWSADGETPAVGHGSNTGETSAENRGRRVPLLSEFRYGSWSRSFRFAAGIQRDAIEAHYRDGLLTVTAPKAETRTTVTVKVAE
jgi:HSP20 family protein